jgi:hypothetical protein
MMKTIVDTPEFTAWLLGELPADEAAAMERAVAADSALQISAREQQQFFHSLSGMMGGAQTTLDARQREKIMNTVRSESNVIALPAGRAQKKQPWGWITLATAALAVMGVWIGSHNPRKPGTGTLAFEEVTREIALLPSTAPAFPGDSGQTPVATAVGGNSVALARRDDLLMRHPSEFLRVAATRIASEPLPSPAELPALPERGFIEQAKHPQAVLPLYVGTASWHWIKRSITEQQQLPHASLVRSEEIINAFGFSAGQVLESESCVLHAQGFAHQGNRARIILQLSNKSQTAAPVSWMYEAPAGCRYRLIGFAAPATAAKSSAVLPAGGRISLMLELETESPIDAMGAILLKAGDGEKRLAVSMSPPSQDAAFFSLLADFSAWLCQPDQAAAPMLQRIAALESGSLSTEQSTALSIMRKTLQDLAH